jgi:hypothetical protein
MKPNHIRNLLTIADMDSARAAARHPGVPAGARARKPLPDRS